MTLPLMKFTPPLISDELHFSRQDLIHKLKKTGSCPKNKLFIEARAGQGKSTLVARYLKEINPSFAWYQIDAEDNDVVLFFKNLYKGISYGFKGFHSDLLANMIDKNEINADDGMFYIRILLDELNGFVQGPHYLVFDDLYFIEPESPVASILAVLVKEAVRDLKIILISREPLETVIPYDGLYESGHLFSDRDLAMTRSEIAEFFGGITDQPVSSDLVNRVFKVTEGWTMGVLTKAHTFYESGHFSWAVQDEAPGSAQKNLKLYFKAEISRHLSQETITLLSRLAFLKSVPVDLAEVLTGEPLISDILAGLVKKNYFTRYTGENRSELVFHHFFQECLREYAAERLDSDEISGLFEAAARWYIKKDQPERGIAHFIRAENYRAADQAVQKVGAELYAKNSVAVLLGALKQVPEEIILDYGWLSCFVGLAIVDQNPPEAFRFFKKAEALFSKENDKTGLMLVSSQLIHFHVWMDSMFSEGEKYLPTAEALYNELSEFLPVQVRINSLYCLACGYTVFKSDFHRAEQYAKMALEVSVDNGFDNYTAMIRLILCYQYAFTGDLERFVSELELLSKMSASGRISSHNLLLINLAWLMYLEMKGDFFNYRIMREHLLKTIENNLAVKSILQPFIMLWDLDMALAEGEYGTARELAKRALALPDAAEAPHYRSQFLHFKAYADALSGKSDAAEKAAMEAISYRHQAGSPFFIMHTEIVVGAALAAAGNAEQAEAILKKAIKTSDTLGGIPDRKAAALAHLIGLRLDKDRIDKEEIATFISILKDNSYVYLISLTPRLFKRILKTAFQNNIQRVFVKQLAGKRFDISFAENGEIIPLLKIRTLGEFSIEKEGKIILTAKDFTVNQLKLLAMLISSRHGYLNVEDIQTGFWPEKSAAKGRASFDTMISRLRKVLKKAVAPQPVGRYLHLQKEQLYFKHVLIDADCFIKIAETGLKYYAAKQFRQAENEFRRAFHFFKGDEFLPGIALDHKSHKFKEYLLQPLINNCARTWSSMMIDSPDYIPADADTLEKMITADSSNIELVKNLYHLRCLKENNIIATRLIRKYRETLRLEGFFPEEIEELVETIWDN